MALDLGRLEVTLAANTQALQSAASTMQSLSGSVQRLQRTVDGSMRRIERATSGAATSSNRLAQSQRRAKKAADDSSLSYRNYERHLNRNRERMRNLVAQIDRMNVETSENSEQLRRLRAQAKQAYTAYSARVREARGDTVKLARAQDTLSASLGTVRRRMGDIRYQRHQKEVSRMSSVLRNLESASVLAVGPLSGVGARIAALGSIANRSQLAIAGLAAGVTGLLFGLFKLGQSAVRASQAMEDMNARFRAATNSIHLMGTEFAFASNTADVYARDVKSLARSYSGFLAAAGPTNLTLDETRQIFQGVTAASAAMRLSSAQTQGAIRAIEQMMSKGNVQAEELRGQLGERLPGAFQIAAEAMDVTTSELNKMLEQGEVLAEDFLPKFAKELERRFASEGKQAVDSLSGSVNMLGNAFFALSSDIDESLGLAQGLADAIRGIAEGMRMLTEDTKHAEAGMADFENRVAIALSEFGDPSDEQLAHFEQRIEQMVNSTESNISNLRKLFKSIHPDLDIGFTLERGLMGTMTQPSARGFVGTQEKSIDLTIEQANKFQDLVDQILKAEERLRKLRDMLRRVDNELENINAKQEEAASLAKGRIPTQGGFGLNFVGGDDLTDLERRKRLIGELWHEHAIGMEEYKQRLAEIESLMGTVGKRAGRSGLPLFNPDEAAGSPAGTRSGESMAQRVEERFKRQSEALDRVEEKAREYASAVQNAEIEQRRLFRSMEGLDEVIPIDPIDMVMNRLDKLGNSYRTTAHAIAQHHEEVGEAVNMNRVLHEDYLETMREAIRVSQRLAEASTARREAATRNEAAAISGMQSQLLTTEELTSTQIRLAQAYERGNISLETYTAAMRSHESVQKKIAQQAENNQRAFENMAQIVSSGFASGAVEGKRFIDILNDVTKSLIQAIIQAQIYNAIMGAAGQEGKGPGIKLTPGGSTAGKAPGKASGGPVSANRPYLVGEEGPELFVPSRSGRVLSNEETMRSGGETNLNVVIENNSQEPVNVKRSQNGRDARVVIGEILAEDFSRGGPASRSMERSYGLRRQPSRR